MTRLPAFEKRFEAKPLLEIVMTYRELLGSCLGGNSSMDDRAAYHMACAVEWAVLSVGDEDADNDTSECVLNHLAAAIAYNKSEPGQPLYYARGAAEKERAVLPREMKG